MSENDPANLKDDPPPSQKTGRKPLSATDILRPSTSQRNEEDDDDTKAQIAKKNKELQVQATEKKEVTNRFAIEEEGDDVASAAELTFFQKLMKKKRAVPPPWLTTGRRELLLKMKSTWLRHVLPRPLLWARLRRSKMSYVGHGDAANKHGVGICWWPEPHSEARVKIAPADEAAAASASVAADGEVYYGCWQDNIMTGHGVLTWFDGDVYLGQFQKGEFHGYGVYKHSDIGDHPGDLYEGRYHKGLRHGSGVYKFKGLPPGGAKKNAPIGDDDPDADEEVAAATDGKAGLRKEVKKPEGGVFIGEWNAGFMQGLGILKYDDGESYAGGWREDVKHGLGILAYGRESECFGDKYEGDFVKGEMKGFGSMFFSDGGNYKGSFEKGLMHGSGVWTQANSVVYCGTWVNGVISGNAVKTTSANTNKCVVLFENGQLTSTRRFESGRDWTDIEAPARASAEKGVVASNFARKIAQDADDAGRRANDSQKLALKAEQEAKECAETAIYLAADYSRLCGLGIWFSDM